MKMLRMVFVLLVAGSCVEDPEPEIQFFPFLNTSVTDINADGVTFKAEVYRSGTTQQVDSYGFRWTKGVKEEGLSEDESETILFDGNFDDSFKKRVTYNLKEEEVYTVQSFVNIGSQEINFNSFVFVSRSTSQPQVTDFYPKSIMAGDTLTIEGTNLTTFHGDFSIFLRYPANSSEQKNFRVFTKLSDSVASFVVPRSFPRSSSVSLVYESLGEYMNLGNIELARPQITSISPLIVTAGTEITITGFFSKVIDYNSIHEQYYGTQIMITELNDNQLTAIVPYQNISSGSLNLAVVVNGTESNYFKIFYEN